MSYLFQLLGYDDIILDRFSELTGRLKSCYLFKDHNIVVIEG